MIPSLFAPIIFQNKTRGRGGYQGVPSILCAQLNLRRSHDARDNLDLRDFKIQFLQEPPYNKDKGHALSRAGYVTYAAAPVGGKPPRAALRIAGVSSLRPSHNLFQGTEPWLW